MIDTILEMGKVILTCQVERAFFLLFPLLSSFLPNLYYNEDKDYEAKIEKYVQSCWILQVLLFHSCLLEEISNSF